MKKEEILEKSKKKAIVGEMETDKIRKGNWIAIIIAGITALIFLVTENILDHLSGYFAIMAIIFAWAAVLYFCQYFMAKRPWQVLIGAVLYTMAFIGMVTLYILENINII